MPRMSYRELSQEYRETWCCLMIARSQRDALYAERDAMEWLVNAAVAYVQAVEESDDIKYIAESYRELLESVAAQYELADLPPAVDSGGSEQ
jgi:hypothetical protein